MLDFLKRTIACAFALFAGLAAAQAQGNGVREFLDLAYYEGADADAERHRLNLVAPDTEEPAPLMMWIPQGAWAFGSRARETPGARRFAEAGIAVAAIDHRMSPPFNGDAPIESGAKHPDHAIDSARAAAWLLANGDDYNVDTDNFFIAGYSSGAHLAALLVMDPRYLADVGVTLDQVRAAIAVGGAYDMERYRDAIFEAFEDAGAARKHIYGVFGSDEMLKPASPNAYLDQARTPMLVMSDATTYTYNTWFEEEVAERGLGDLIQFIHRRDYEHGPLWLGLQNEPDFEPRDQIVAYIREHVR
ncbi:MAG: hypothetical protein Tsb0010_08320 [Parvularculaceae bacterium]